jgi:shikimate kinase
MKNLILCGFMGCGKTSLAKSLSTELNMPLIDTDEEIVKREGRSIAEIFSQKGEEYFRNLETELIKELTSKDGVIISLGGGLAANEKNHPYLKQGGKIILLDCGINKTLSRISGDGTRPLTAGGREDIIARYNLRKPIYESVADVVIDSGHSKKRTLEQALESIKEWL